MVNTITDTRHAPLLYNPPDSARRNNDRWSIDAFHDSDRHDRYEDSFVLLLSKIGVATFPDLLKVRKEHGADTNVLDLMGGGYFINPQDYKNSVDTMTGFRLDNPEAEYEKGLKSRIKWENNVFKKFRLYGELFKFKALQKQEKRKVVFGSIFEEKPWEDLDQSMKERGIDKFDVVVCRPEGPFMTGYMTNDTPLDDRQKLHYGLVFTKTFDLLQQRVNQTNGTIFTQIPEVFDGAMIDIWKQKTSEKYGMDIKIEKEPRIKHATQKDFWVAMCQYGIAKT